ncbi:MAG: chorismate synthase [Dehalococcoidia bacterium]|nr:chorismate synthase [Dehalococcoidia bacterium]
MSSNQIGKFFTVTSFGESHGQVIGVVIDGCPAGLPLDEADLQPDLNRRKPGQGVHTTARRETDRAEIWSGVFGGRTTGAPLCLVVHNQDADAASYETLEHLLRPGHADYPARIKYGGYADYRGGGRFSGRITAGWVMAGAVAKKLLATIGVEISAYTVAIGGVEASLPNCGEGSGPLSNPVFCPDPVAAEQMMQAIGEAIQAGDSLGGVIELMAVGVPLGWGDPVGDGLDGALARAFFAIPAVKGVEFGAGFGAARLRGSENNDPYVIQNGQIRPLTNQAGGTLGGLASGLPVVARIAFKPTPSIARAQRTVDLQAMAETTLRIEGRHDPCVVPRAVVVVEALAAIVLGDFALRAGAIPKVMVR